MRIVLDMQGAQTESRFRGIGRYTMSLAKAIARNRGEHEIILALSGLFPETIEPIRAEFDGLLPQENIRVWQAPGPVQECQPGNEWRRKVAEHIREAFLASLRPDIIHVFSLFEGYVDDAVTSIGLFDNTTPVSVTLYDLIPLIHADHYLKPNPLYHAYYTRKLEHLKKASLLLAISESSRKEAIEHLGFPEDAVINVSTAVDECFRPLALSKEEEERIRRKFGILKPFVLYTGGIDHRKNIEGLIRAYAGLSEKLRDGYQLVMAGKMPEGERRRLLALAQQYGLKSNEIIFTGYVSDEDLVRLYNLCTVFVFPSLHEGFGLPALEAMACGAAVIGSNTTSIPEVIGREDALFDPHKDDAIAEKLELVLTDEDFRRELQHHGIEQAKRFSWDESARWAIAAFEAFYAKKADQP
ncbi:MAG: glycosyltransferase family 4 protein, partial [Dissulfurimicrobium sp.]|uniref:glycosyltransferase family 4 protein n=1 Tax=Dissulfurimicrobium sp. TaxID=2022436 RepID=UPI003D0DAC7D